VLYELGLMLSERMDAVTAAFHVGHESPSQFDHKYNRLFGAPPPRDVNALHQTAGSVTVNEAG
jgi:transcriptional regulator GlxA family with amidase domain